jgi:hypothetical protein
LGARGYGVPDERELLQALWLLVAERLIFPDFTSDYPHPANWVSETQSWIWRLTPRGVKVAQSTADEVEPDDREGYLALLRRRVADIDEMIMAYTEDALGAYHAECYLASTVMLGVASERAFQLLGEAFCSWLPKREADTFGKVFDNPRRNYINKFEEFRKRLEPRRGELPEEFTDSMALTLDAVADLLRVNRNDAGHPTGRRFDRDEAYVGLQVFARYVAKLHGLRSYFAKSPAAR